MKKTLLTLLGMFALTGTPKAQEPPQPAPIIVNIPDIDLRNIDLETGWTIDKELEQYHVQLGEVDKDLFDVGTIENALDFIPPKPYETFTPVIHVIGNHVSPNHGRIENRILIGASSPIPSSKTDSSYNLNEPLNSPSLERPIGISNATISNFLIREGYISIVGDGVNVNNCYILGGSEIQLLRGKGIVFANVQNERTAEIRNNIVAGYYAGIVLSSRLEAPFLKIRGNLLYENRIGIKSEDVSLFDLGTNEDMGSNAFIGNDVFFDLINPPETIQAQGNMFVDKYKVLLTEEEDILSSENVVIRNASNIYNQMKVQRAEGDKPIEVMPCLETLPWAKSPVKHWEGYP